MLSGGATKCLTASKGLRPVAVAQLVVPIALVMFAAALYLVFTSISLSVLKRINARYSLGTEKVQL